MKKIVVLFVIEHWYAMDVNDEENISEEIDFSDDITIITCQSGDLVRHIKSSNQNINRISLIDLECLDRQMSQEGKDLRTYKKWKVLPFLKHHKVLSDDFRLTQSQIKECLQAIVEVYKLLLEKDQVEVDRFDIIEAPINRIIYNRQLRGIRIDSQLAVKLCKQLERSIYANRNVLQREHKIFDPASEAEQIAYLDNRKYPLVRSPQFTFKSRRNDDLICWLFYEMMRNQQDLDSLLFMLSHWGGRERAMPTYFGFGTITSRITVREPAIQNLRKGNREIIIPDEGYRLLYVDYSQFEAGILASLSQDEALLKLYNSDIYGDLANEVLCDREKRSDAKVIFYRYMYGDTTLSEASRQYFTKFINLDKFIKKTNVEISTNYRIGTELGNYRSGIDNNSWALSHLVQATASLIYKRAVIRVTEEVPAAEFLIPMHDGTLYQISNLCYEQAKGAVELIYKDEFAKACSGITPKINSSDKFH